MDRGLYFAQAFTRLVRQEERARDGVLDDSDRAWDEVQNCVSRLRVEAVLRGVERAEASLRSQFEEAVVQASEAAKLCHAQAHLKTIASKDPSVAGSELRSRRDVLEEEQTERRKILHLLHAKELLAANMTLAKQESSWRNAIVTESTRGFDSVRSLHASCFMRFIQSPQYGDSEPTLRLFHDLCERKIRFKLAIRFCCLRVMWEEAWSRLTIRLEYRTLMEYLELAKSTMEAEAVDRFGLRRFYEPVNTDICERLAEKALRIQRRSNKIEWLKAMRMREIAKIRQQEEFRDEYVIAWKLDEIGRILEAQDRRLEMVAEHGEDPETYERLHSQYHDDVQFLTRPTTSFGEITAYHKRLRGFDELFQSVERAAQIDLPAIEAFADSAVPARVDDEESRLLHINRAIAVTKVHWEGSASSSPARQASLRLLRSSSLSPPMDQPRQRSSPQPSSPERVTNSTADYESVDAMLPDMDSYIDQLSAVHSRMLRELSR